MLIYLDAMLVQYCADYDSFIFGDVGTNPVSEPKLAKELNSLRRLVELEQFGNWNFAAPQHLMKELLAGMPAHERRRVYEVLLQAWQESGSEAFLEINEQEILSIDQSLKLLKLKGAADRRHLAEAIGLNASWFLTNDGEVIRKTRKRGQMIGQVRQVRIARPSECIDEISLGLFLKSE